MQTEEEQCFPLSSELPVDYVQYKRGSQQGPSLHDEKLAMAPLSLCLQKGL